MEISPQKFASALGLNLISGAARETESCITVADIWRPGLQFTGYFDVFSFERPQVIGKAEMVYLDNMQLDVREERLKQYFSYGLPCIVIARGMECPEILAKLAKENNVPIYGTEEETSAFSAKAMGYLSEVLAPRQTCHGVLLDVYGMGVLITGKSGVGKSECALELVKHGHQLVADDAVEIFRVGRSLWGEAPEMIRNFMELRGVGIVDIKEIFGIGAMLRRVRIDMVIHLEIWRDDKEYDRLGTKDQTMEIMGVQLPLLDIPVHPGRSLATIVEIAARNRRLKAEGYDAVKVLDDRLRRQYEK